MTLLAVCFQYKRNIHISTQELLFHCPHIENVCDSLHTVCRFEKRQTVFRLITNGCFLNQLHLERQKTVLFTFKQQIIMWKSYDFSSFYTSADLWNRCHSNAQKYVDGHLDEAKRYALSSENWMAEWKIYQVITQKYRPYFSSARKQKRLASAPHFVFSKANRKT